MKINQQLKQYRVWEEGLAQWMSDQEIPVDVAITLTIRMSFMLALYNQIPLDRLKSKTSYLYDLLYEEFAIPNGPVH